MASSHRRCSAVTAAYHIHIYDIRLCKARPFAAERSLLCRSQCWIRFVMDNSRDVKESIRILSHDGIHVSVMSCNGHSLLDSSASLQNGFSAHEIRIPESLLYMHGDGVNTIYAECLVFVASVKCFVAPIHGFNQENDDGNHNEDDDDVAYIMRLDGLFPILMPTNQKIRLQLSLTTEMERDIIFSTTNYQQIARHQIKSTIFDPTSFIDITQAKIVIGPLRFPLHSLDSKVDGNKLWIDSRLDSSTRSKTLDMLSRAHQGIVDYFCTPLFHQRCNIVILAGSHFFVECCPGLIICAEPLLPNEHEDECVDWQKMMKTYYSMLCGYFSFLWKFSAREAWFQDCLCAFLALHLIRHNSDVDDYEKFTYRHRCVEFEPVDYASPLFAKGLVFFQKAADLNPMALRDALALAVRVYGGQSTTIEEITSLVEKECLLGVNDTITNTWRHSWNAPHFQQSAEFDRGLQFDSFIGRQVENNLEMGKTKWHPSDCPNVQNQRINLLDPTCAIVSTPTMPSKCRVENCPQSKTSVSSESSSDEDIADDDSYQTKPRHRLHRAVPIASLSEEQNETIDPVMSGDYEDYSLDVDSAQLTNQRMTPSVPLLGQSFKPYETRTTQRVRFASDDFQSTKTTKQSSQRNENVFDIAEYATKSEDKKHPDESISVPIAKPALDFYDRISDPQPHFQLDGRHSSIIQASINPLFRPYRADLPNPKLTQTLSLSMSASTDHTREKDIEIGMKPHHEKALNFPITSHGRPTMLSNHYMASSKSPSRINRLVESHLNRYRTHPSIQYPHLQGKKQNQWLQMSSSSIQIHHLAARGNIEASIEALHHGASLACVDENGRNAIHHATISAHSVWIETILSMRFVQHDLQKIINMTDRRGWTPMDYAAHYESIELIGERKQAYGDIMVFFRDLISKQSASDHHPYGAACSGTNIVPLHISRERLFDRIMQPSFPQGSSPKTDESYREFEGTKAKKVVGAPDYLLKGDEKGEAKISKRLYSQLKHNQSQ